MANVTYLLGAGASANALPVVKNIPAALNELIDLINAETTITVSSDQSGLDIGGMFKLGKEILLSDLNWLKEKAERHSTIDTFAKKLTITNKTDDLIRLKYALSALLVYLEQNKPADKRYDTFFASIINNKGQLPNNIKIVSWNYDRQIEKAYLEYNPNNEIHYYEKARKELKFLTQFNYYVNNNPSSEKFEVIKLNGSIVNLQYNKNLNSIPFEIELDLDPIHNNNKLKMLCFNYSQFKERKEFKRPSLRFAWEDPSDWDEGIQEETFINTVSNKMVATEILVIIGYSFPFFNREIDRKVWEYALNKVSKVYIQDIYPKDIETKLRATFPNEKFEVVHIKVGSDISNDEFYLPSELTL